MKKGKAFWLLEIFLLILLIWVLGMIWNGNKPARKKRVVCVLNDSSSQHWVDLYEGMQLSAKQHGMEFVMADTEKMQTADDVKDVIADEMTDGMDALIVEQIGTNPDDMLPKSLGRKIPKVYLNGSGGTDSGQTNVSFKTSWMVRKMLQEIKKDARTGIKGQTVGIVLPKASNPYLAECVKVARELFEQEGVTEAWTVRVFGQDQDKEDQMKKQCHVNYVLTFDDSSLKTVAEFAQNGGFEGSGIYGIGNSEDNIWYLDSGIIQGLLAPDTFMMGYRAMEATWRILNHQSVKNDLDVSGRYFRRDDLFDTKENQYYLFPREQM